MFIFHHTRIAYFVIIVIYFTQHSASISTRYTARSPPRRPLFAGARLLSRLAPRRFHLPAMTLGRRGRSICILRVFSFGSPIGPDVPRQRLKNRLYRLVVAAKEKYSTMCSCTTKLNDKNNMEVLKVVEGRDKTRVPLGSPAVACVSHTCFVTINATYGLPPCRRSSVRSAVPIVMTTGRVARSRGFDRLGEM